MPDLPVHPTAQRFYDWGETAPRCCAVPWLQPKPDSPGLEKVKRNYAANAGGTKYASSSVHSMPSASVSLGLSVGVPTEARCRQYLCRLNNPCPSSAIAPGTSAENSKEMKYKSRYHGTTRRGKSCFSRSKAAELAKTAKLLLKQSAKEEEERQRKERKKILFDGRLVLALYF